MPYVVDMSPAVLALMEELPARTCTCLFEVLEHMAEMAALCSPDDERWEQFAQREQEGLRFYVEGCCVWVEIHSQTRCIRVREIGRVLVHLPAESAGNGLNL